MPTLQSNFNRSNPSSEYARLLKQYQQLHAEGDPARGIPAENFYPGKSLPFHAPAIKQMIDMTGAKTVLDYGCGKGLQYTWQDLKFKDGSTAKNMQTYWGVDQIRCYDPAVPKFMALPNGKFDGVVSTDVLEHVPTDDVDWILNEIFAYADKFVFLNIACHMAKAILPDGNNAHTTAKPVAWWKPKIEAVSALYPHVKYHVVLENKVSFILFKHSFRTRLRNF
jgi:hypothetical protein